MKGGMVRLSKSVVAGTMDKSEPAIASSWEILVSNHSLKTKTSCGLGFG